MDNLKTIIVDGNKFKYDFDRVSEDYKENQKHVGEIVGTSENIWVSTHGCLHSDYEVMRNLRFTLRDSDRLRYERNRTDGKTNWDECIRICTGIKHSEFLEDLDEVIKIIKKRKIKEVQYLPKELYNWCVKFFVNIEVLKNVLHQMYIRKDVDGKLIFLSVGIPERWLEMGYYFVKDYFIPMLDKLYTTMWGKRTAEYLLIEDITEKKEHRLITFTSILCNVLCDLKDKRLNYFTLAHYFVERKLVKNLHSQVSFISEGISVATVLPDPPVLKIEDNLDLLEYVDAKGKPIGSWGYLRLKYFNNLILPNGYLEETITGYQPMYSKIETDFPKSNGMLFPS